MLVSGLKDGEGRPYRVIVLRKLSRVLRWRRIEARRLAKLTFSECRVDSEALLIGICFGGPHKGRWIVVQGVENAEWRYFVPEISPWADTRDADRHVDEIDLVHLFDGWSVRFLPPENRALADTMLTRNAELLFAYGISTRR